MDINKLFTTYNPLSQVNLDDLIIKIILAIIIIAIGVVIGKLINYGIKRLSQQIELTKYIRSGIIDLARLIIRWSIYILFISMGLNYLEVPALTKFFTNILIIIPAFTGALILIVIGFSIAYYLKKIIKNNEIAKGEIIGEVIFYFVLLIFGIYSIKTALISFDETTANQIILIITAIASASVGYLFVKKEINKKN